jgi:hypothetical protein
MRASGEAEQASPPWCWAACISAILHAQGHELAQRHVVSETYGRAPGPPARTATSPTRRQGAGSPTISAG